MSTSSKRSFAFAAALVLALLGLGGGAGALLGRDAEPATPAPALTRIATTDGGSSMSIRQDKPNTAPRKVAQIDPYARRQGETCEQHCEKMRQDCLRGPRGSTGMTDEYMVKACAFDHSACHTFCPEFRPW